MSQYGSMTNMLSDGVATFDPEVGMGATILLWSDREPATIVQVDHFSTGPRKGKVKAVWVTNDIATRTDRNGMSERQTYAFTTNPDAGAVQFTKRSDGRFKEAGSDSAVSLRIGSRDKYHDYSF